MEPIPNEVREYVGSGSVIAGGAIIALRYLKSFWTRQATVDKVEEKTAKMLDRLEDTGEYHRGMYEKTLETNAKLMADKNLLISLYISKGGTRMELENYGVVECKCKEEHGKEGEQ